MTRTPKFQERELEDLTDQVLEVNGITKEELVLYQCVNLTSVETKLEIDKEKHYTHPHQLREDKFEGIPRVLRRKGC